MTELSPVWYVQDVTGATAPTYDDTPTPAPNDLTPTYDETIYLAGVGRACVVSAGYTTLQRPPVAIVIRALRQQGLPTEQGERNGN